MENTDYLKVLDSEVLSDNWATLTKYRVSYRRRDGEWQEQVREVYDRGHGAVCLLHNPETDCVLLTRQFRLPVWLTGRDPFVIEAPAGLLEGMDPAERIREELIEETGFQVSALQHLYDVHMSPGSVTEYLAFFTGTYHMKDQVTSGGGKEDEGEDIEVLHVPLEKALDMIRNGEIRDSKTIILLQELALRKFSAKAD
ncbi:MAG: NUDIX domain-containing protein [Roseibium sp.]|uniref:NUDIX domain-containing protein n=1 Tax=Roseibium sp. TaxID=1936156 RepID=UPI001B2D4D48|nr:NUDIX domain-containing protein [Roseibium sp.]MBO6892344.1 NUDIX domain-containing protein [Roseibium sp.]MBO6929005.1 NUDIX domain-containing protein [Roseibium sp.]